MRPKHLLTVAGGCLLAALALSGQNIPADELRISSQPYRPPAPRTLSVQANLVEVRVVVRDTAGAAVGGLQQSDFQVFDNGKPQIISNFSVETSRAVAAATGTSAAAPAKPAPPARYIALFFDDLSMPLGDLVPARKATEDFVRRNLEPGDRVGVFTSSAAVTLEFTDDSRKVLDTLAQLRQRLRRASLGVSCPRMTPYQAHLIEDLHDIEAIDLGVEQGIAARCFSRDPMSLPQLPAVVRNQAAQMMGLVDQFSRDTLGVVRDVIRYLVKMPGRRMLVLTSSGFLTLTMPLQRVQDNLVEMAVGNGVVINSLDARGLVAESSSFDPEGGPPVPLPGRPDLQSLADRLAAEQRTQMNEALAYLAYGTGGRFFHNNNDLSRGVRELAAVPEYTYVLGFVPSDLKFDRSYHNLKVTLSDTPKLTLDARRGYFAPDKPKPVVVPTPDKFDAAVNASDAIAEFPASITTRSEKSATGDSILRVRLHVETRDLPFLRRDNRSRENLRFVLAVFDLQGKFLTGIEGEMTLALKDDTLARLTERGLEQGLSMRVPSGNYRVRLVMQERMHGRLAAESQSVAIQ